MTLSLDNLTFYFGRDYYISLNLTAEDFDPLGITSCLNVVKQVCEFTSLAMYPFVMFIIMTQSPPRMNYYRYLLMAQITSGAIFNLLFVLANPIIVFPFLIAYTDGYLDCDYTMSTIMFLFIVLSIFTLGVMTIFQLVYRVLITFDIKHIFYMFSHPKIYTFCIGFCFFLVGAVIITPLSLDNPQSDIHSLEIDFPALKEIFDKHPYTMGYFPEHHGLIRYVINIVFLISIALIPAIAIFCAIMIYRLRQMKKALLKQSYRLHAMLCRALFVQTGLAVFILMPCVIAFTAALQFSLIEGNVFFPMCVVGISVYSIMYVVCMVYFITPYRRFVVNVGRWMAGRPGLGAVHFTNQGSRVFYAQQRESIT